MGGGGGGCEGGCVKQRHNTFDFSEGEYIINIMVAEYMIDIFTGSPLIEAFLMPNISTCLDKQTW